MFSGPVPVPFVEVVWDDAETFCGWDVAPEKLKARLVLTCGFLVKETEDHLLIANTISPDDEGNLHNNSRIQIPTNMVKHYKVIY